MSNSEGTCTPSEYANTDGSIHCLSRGQSIGLTLVAESGFISLFSIVFVFGLILRNMILHVRRSRKHKWRFIHQPTDIFMLSLFWADGIQAMGAVLDVKWINDGKVTVGSLCTAQGVIQQLGETGVAITTLVIAIHTFVGVWWRKGTNSLFAAYVIMATEWLFVILFVAIGNAVHRNKSQLYISPTPYWCWIGDSWLGERIGGEYVWFWLTLFVSTITYALLYFWSRGNITLDQDSWWRFSVHHAAKMHDEDLRKNALRMIAYPIVYSILVLPLSIVRWIGWTKGDSVPSAATLAVITIYGLSGFCNVALLLWTRPASVLFGKPEEGVDDDGKPSSLQSVSASRRAMNEVPNDDYLGLELGRLPTESSDGGRSGVTRH